MFVQRVVDDVMVSQVKETTIATISFEMFPRTQEILFNTGIVWHMSLIFVKNEISLQRWYCIGF